MARIPTKVASRISEALKRYQPIVSSAASRDVNESDTSVIITDLLADLFGYDKYSEITTEYAVRGTYCDLAIKLEGKPRLMIEVKAVGLELKDNHIKQAVDYAANVGVDWVVLTNGCKWKIFRLTFGKPIESEEIAEIDLLALNPRASESVDALYVLSKEGFLASALADFYAQRQAVNKHSVAAILLSEAVLKIVKRELARVFTNVRIQLPDIEKILRQEVLKREVVEGEVAEEAIRKVHRSLDRIAKQRDRVEPEIATVDSEQVLNAPVVPLNDQIPE